MIEAVLDSSAVLAAIRGEPGAELVEPLLAMAPISAVNYAEIVSRLVDFGSSPEDAIEAAGHLGLDVRPLDVSGAAAVGALRAATRSRGLSLGDRACLALAKQLGLPVFTADRAWAELDLGIEVVLIR